MELLSTIADGEAELEEALHDLDEAWQIIDLLVQQYVDPSTELSTEEKELLSTIADLEQEVEEALHDLDNANSIIDTMSNVGEPFAEEEPVPENTAPTHKLNFNPQEPCYHAKVLLASGIEPVTVMNITSGIIQPSNLEQVPRENLMNNFGLTDKESQDIYVSCEDFATVYLYRWEDIKHLGLVFKAQDLGATGFFGYSGG